MAVPKFSPVGPIDIVRSYGSPDHVPDGWRSDRPAEIGGRQPEGGRMGYQGPDQGYALWLANRFRDRIHVFPPESVDDAICGCTNIALKRASLFGRAPVIHDLTIGFTIWGWLDESPSDELRARRRQLFEGVADTNHHYTEGRLIADLVPESTLRMTPEQAQAACAEGRWQELNGATAPDAETVA